MIRTVSLSWGRYGGWYVTHGRVCLGRVALTWLSFEIDDLMRWADQHGVQRGLK